MSDFNILEMSDIRKGFFGAEVLHGINLTLKKGEVLGLVGENGAGKSTLMNVLGGVLVPESGEMKVRGEMYSPVSAKDAQAAKIAFIHQELNLFSNLSVAENLFIDDLPTKGLNKIQYKHMRQTAKEYLEKFKVNASPNSKISTLPMGVRQTVEITKAIIKDAEIIIFDEPTTSLSQVEKDNLFEIIQNLKETGVSIIYISHILEDVFNICDRISVLRDGHMIGTKNTVKTKKEEIISLMVGRKLTNVYPTIDKVMGDVLFEAKNICVGKSVQDASLKLRSGEILGIFGLMGAGRTEFMRAIFGVDKIDNGEILFKGNVNYKPSPIQSIQQGIAFVTEDRRLEGLLMPKSVEDNIVLVKYGDITKKLGVIDKSKVEEMTDKSIKDLSIKVQDKKLQLVRNLSGGNQQKVVIAKWLLKSPEILIMDEPTRGVDVGAKYEIYAIIQQLAKEGSGILFVSSEMEELIGVCDRIAVMKGGRVVGEIDRSEYNQETIMHYALAGGI